MVLSRRDLIRASLGLGAAALAARVPLAASQDPILSRAIPSSGERIPAVGLGSARTFSVRGSGQMDELRQVLRLFFQQGGRVFDTAPTYGRSEVVSGQLAQELGIQNELFFATKISTGGGRVAGERQEEESLRLWGRDTIDLNQVHNLRGVPEHLATIRAAKAAGRTRYVGVTTSRAGQFADMEAVMRREELDFVQLNYSLGERLSAERLIPLAQDRGMAILVNEPYNAGRLFGVVRGHELPGWAPEIDCESWGQVFLKYILSHPAITAVIPATGDPEHLLDNMGAGRGVLPDEAMRTRIEREFDQMA